MPKPLRAVALLLLVVIAGAAAGVAYVLITLDPNDFKPRIAALAERQHVQVDIQGDLAWQLVPRPGVQVGRTRVRAADPGIPELDFERAALSVTWGSLLRGTLRIGVLNIEGADIRVATAAQAAATAAAPLAAAAASAPRDTGQPMPTLALDQVEIARSRITITGAGEPRVLDNLNFSSRDMVLDGTPFPVRLAFDYRDPALPAPLAVAFAADLTVAQAARTVATENAHVSVTPAERTALEAQFALSVDLAQDRLALSALRATWGALTATGDLAVTDLGAAPAVRGQLHIPPADPRPLLAEWGIALPKSGATDTFAKVGGETRYGMSADALELDDLKLTFDATEIRGAVEARLASPRELRATFHGTRLDLDRYAPADRDGSGTAGALLAPLAAPVAFLRGGSGTLDLDWDALTVARLSLEGLRLRAAFAGDDVTIREFSARTLGGNTAGSAQVQGVTGPAPSATFKERLTGISLARVRETLAPGLDLDGTLDLSFQGSARGRTGAELDQTLDAAGTFAIAAPRLDRVNIERAYCDLAALVDKDEKRKDWPKGTAFRDAAGEFHLAGPRLTLARMTTGVGNLALRGEGTLDRAARSYDLLAIAHLNGERTSADGCQVRSEHLRERDIPLRCQGSFAKDAAVQCAPDGDLVKQLVADRVQQELQDSHGGSKKGKAVEGLLRGLLGGKKKDRD